MGNSGSWPAAVCLGSGEAERAMKSIQVDEAMRSVATRPEVLLRRKRASGRTLVHEWASLGRKDLLEALIAALQADNALSSYILTNGKMVCETAVPGSTTAYRSKVACQRLLNQVSTGGITPLMLSAAYGHPDVTKLLLLKARSDPWLSDDNQAFNPLHHAAHGGHASCITTLLTTIPPAALMHGNRRYIDSRSYAGLTALHLAAGGAHELALGTLLQHGADMNLRTTGETVLGGKEIPCKSTALHILAAVGDDCCTLILLKHYVTQISGGALISDPRCIKNDNGQMPFAVARTMGREGLSDLLHPHTDLRALFLPSDLQSFGPLSLSQLAAAVVQQTLTANLQRLADSAKSMGTGGTGGTTEKTGAQNDHGPCGCDQCELNNMPIMAYAPSASAAGPAAFGEHRGPYAGGAGGKVKGSSQDACHACDLCCDRSSSSSSSSSTDDGACSCCQGSEAGAESPLAACRGAAAAAVPAAQPGPSSSCGSSSQASDASDSSDGSDASDASDGISPSEGSSSSACLRHHQTHQTHQTHHVHAASSEGKQQQQPGLMGVSKVEAQHVECSICMDAYEAVQVAGCGHRMCATCAGELCSRIRDRPLACPLCRQVVRGFVGLQAGRMHA